MLHVVNEVGVKDCEFLLSNVLVFLVLWILIVARTSMVVLKNFTDEGEAVIFALHLIWIYSLVCFILQVTLNTKVTLPTASKNCWNFANWHHMTCGYAGFVYRHRCTNFSKFISVKSNRNRVYVISNCRGLSVLTEHISQSQPSAFSFTLSLADLKHGLITMLSTLNV